MSDTPDGLTPLHRAVLAGDLAAIGALLPDKAALTAKTTAMLTSSVLNDGKLIFRPGSTSFYPPKPVDLGGPDRAFDKGANPLHLAVAIGDRAAVDLLLTHKARLKTRDGIGATALHLAALGGHVAVVERLLQAPVDVHAATRTRKSLRFLDVGVTPLLAALEGGAIEIVAALLARGADMHAVTKAGIGAALFAARGGSVACLDAVVAAGVRVDAPPAHLNFPLKAAIERGHLALALRLIELGAPSETERGYQALRAAVERDDRVMRQALLDAGLRPLPDHGIESAIRGNDFVYVQTWLDAGNDPDDGGKGSHLWIAAALGKAAIVDLLISRGADVNAHHGRGTALHVALQNGHLDVVDRVLAANPDCAILDEHGNGPLTAAIFKRGVTHAHVARMLACGANPHSVNRHGSSVIEMAERLDDPALMDLLRGVSPEGAVDRAWRSPTTSAVLRDAAPDAPWKRLHAALWDELVPPRGAAPTVQGELVRCIGSLTDEAYRNGNINWSERQVDQIATLRAHLLDGTFSATRTAELSTLLTRLGHHRRPDLSGDGSPHYRVTEAVVAWCLRHRTLIPLG